MRNLVDGFAMGWGGRIGSARIERLDFGARRGRKLRAGRIYQADRDHAELPMLDGDPGCFLQKFVAVSNADNRRIDVAGDLANAAQAFESSLALLERQLGALALANLLSQTKIDFFQLIYLVRQFVGH